MDQMWAQLNESFDNLMAKLNSWLDAIVVNLPNVILAAVVLVAGIFLTRRMRKYFEKLFGRFSKNVTVNRLLANIGTSIFFLIILFIVLSILGLDTALTGLLASAGVAGLAVGLALQEPIVNLFSGVMMSARNFFRIGDLVETNDHFGIVEKISLRSTTLKTMQGQEVIIPNKDVYQKALINYSTSGFRRVDLVCGISYGDDLKKVKQLAIQAVADQVEHEKDKAVELFYTGFGDSSINFVIRFWLPTGAQKSYLQAQSDAIMALKETFDANDITIPFPIRTLDFGIKGGEKLDQVIPALRVKHERENGQE